MESTGVYWIALFQILEARGFEVKLVNAHHVKTLPGRKSDVLDCQWIQQLHSCGLLSASFRLQDQVCVLRSYIRQRDNLVRSACVHVQRIQKALTEMNVLLHQVVSDITGQATFLSKSLTQICLMSEVGRERLISGKKIRM